MTLYRRLALVCLLYIGVMSGIFAALHLFMRPAAPDLTLCPFCHR